MWTNDKRRGPLADLRVVELARVLAGPWCGQLLADLGAEVIKVERPGAGDDTREWGPPFVIDADGTNLGAAFFHATNRGKLGREIDFASEEGREAVRELVRDADVVIENFKTGTLARYGLDHASLSAINPRLITCSITGFGQTGPYSHRAGYDFIIQAMGGLMSMTGEPDGAPQKAGLAAADLFTGVYATVAILAAVNRRTMTGKGAHIDMSLLDTLVSAMAIQEMNWLVSGVVPHRIGNGHANLAPYQSFPTADGDLVIAAGNDDQFRRLCLVLEIDIAGDPRFTTNATRVTNRHALISLVSAATKGWVKVELAQQLEAVGVPAGPILNVAEALDDVHVKARGMVIDTGGIPGIASPIVVDGERMVARTASPRINLAGSH
jgi:crotonobetainyl-CoA:carnitine CoA-transferase CaiB-like acyl-CoA transferase